MRGRGFRLRNNMCKAKKCAKVKGNKRLIQGCGRGSGKEMASMSHCGGKLNRIFPLEDSMSIFPAFLVNSVRSF